MDENKLLDAINGMIKIELEGLRQEIRTDNEKFRQEIKADNEKFRQEMKTEMSGFKKEIKTEISGFRTEMLDFKKDIKQEIKEEMAESKQILRALEHSAEVNKSVHDVMQNDIAHIKGDLEGMKKKLLTLEAVT